jgi:hypothetical protein
MLQLHDVPNDENLLLHKMYSFIGLRKGKIWFEFEKKVSLK